MHELGIIDTSGRVASVIPATTQVRVWKRLLSKPPSDWPRRLIVATDDTQWPAARDWVRRAPRGRVVATLVFPYDDVGTASDRVQGSGLAHVLVTQDVEVARRLARGWEVGRPASWIVDARLVDHGRTLRVTDAKLSRHEICVADMPLLSRIPDEQRQAFEIVGLGRGLRWTDLDLDVDLEGLLGATGAESAAFSVERRAFGEAVRRVREAAGIRQFEVADVTERQVRRIEHGEVVPRLATLRALARAHGLELDAYLDRVAAESARRS